MKLFSDWIPRIKRETFVADVAAFDELPSTNDYALEQAARSATRQPLLVIARRQTRGRGRGSNRWWSGEGALTFSLLFEASPPVREDFSPLVPLAMGAALCEAIATACGNHAVGLKWPNDVYAAGKKIAGVLIERPSAAPGALVVGIGLNLNNSLHGAPAEIAGRAVSVYDLLGKRHDEAEVLLDVIRSIERQLELLRESPQATLDRCRALCILSGENVAVVQGSRRIVGVCRGIQDDGALGIRTAAGEQRCIAGSVELIG